MIDDLTQSGISNYLRGGACLDVLLVQLTGGTGDAVRAMQ